MALENARLRAELAAHIGLEAARQVAGLPSSTPTAIAAANAATEGGRSLNPASLGPSDSGEYPT